MTEDQKAEECQKILNQDCGILNFFDLLELNQETLEDRFENYIKESIKHGTTIGSKKLTQIADDWHKEHDSK